MGESAQAEPTDRDGSVGRVFGRLDIDPQCPQATECRCTVGARRVAAQGGRAICEGSQYGVSMRNRLIAGNAQTASNVTRGFDGHRRGGGVVHARTIHQRITTTRSLLAKQRAGSYGTGDPYSSMSDIGHAIRLACPSHFDMLDFVQLLADHIRQVGGLDEDSVHWVGVAVRESVINAIKHGNGESDSPRSRWLPPWIPTTCSSPVAAASSSCGASWTI